MTGSARLRNASAQKGFEAVSVLQRFVDNYPEEAKSLNLTKKEVLFLNAEYFQIEEKAKRDSRIIEHFCGNKTKENSTN